VHQILHHDFIEETESETVVYFVWIVNVGVKETGDLFGGSDERMLIARDARGF